MLARVQMEVDRDYVCPQALLGVLPKGSRVLLESTLTNTQHRWAILAYNPDSIFLSRNGQTSLNGVKLEGENPFVIFSRLLESEEPFAPITELPFVGGWIGCLAYESVRFLESVPTKHEHCDFDLLFYKVESCYVFDLVEERLFYISSSGRIPEMKAYKAKARLMQKHPDRLSSPRRVLRSFIEKNGKYSNFSEADYCRSIELLKEHILDGESYQANLSQRWTFPSDAEPHEIYRELSELSPVPFAGFFEWGDALSIISASPERLFEIRKRQIFTRPIAGTRRCGNQEETARFFSELRHDAKENAEHAMLVDLARNDLGRVCQYGTVKISQFMELVPYSTVIHTESEIEGILKRGASFYEVMKALFPGGTITGVPKIRTMEILNTLEPCERGVYTGSMGYWSRCGHADFNIMIRPVICKPGWAHTHAGGGITIKSDPKREYKETWNKALPQLAAITRTWRSDGSLAPPNLPLP